MPLSMPERAWQGNHSQATLRTLGDGDVRVGSGNQRALGRQPAVLSGHGGTRQKAKGTDVTWVGISGSWRYAPPGLPDAVHREVTSALGEGKSIVTGGALGVDYWATETALGIDPARLKVILPTSQATYAAHYRRRAAEGVISAQQAEDLVRQLQDVAQAGGLVEHPERPQVVNVTTYYRRNQGPGKVMN